MGNGNFSYDRALYRSSTNGYNTKSTSEIFKARDISNAMNPKGIVLRESRDSAEHPNSVAIILALDVTGSMGIVPHFLVKEGFPNIMKAIMEKGMKDPQILFLGIGDHFVDSSPLQVGQFESSDELLDKWLTDVYLEGGGGGNGGESYLLAWYFAGRHTAIDCFEKRKQKGYLFTVGDEPVHKSIAKNAVEHIMGDGEYGNYTAQELLANAQAKYNVYHIHIRETSTGRRPETIQGWKEIMGNNLIVIDNHEQVAKAIADAITNTTGKVINEGKAQKKDEVDML